jgi:hypothetical protein
LIGLALKKLSIISYIADSEKAILQMSQIQKNIAKRNFTATSSSRKKIRPKKR